MIFLTRYLSKTINAAAIAVAFMLPSISFAETHFVEIKGFVYIPAELSIKAGDSVVWKNLDIVPHTATDANKKWDTGEIKPGESKQLKFEKALDSAYYCVYHPSMKAGLTLGE